MGKRCGFGLVMDSGFYLFISPPCLLSRNYSFLPSSISPSTFPSLPAPSLPLFLSLSRSSSTSPLPSVWSMASFPVGLSARIRLQSVQLSGNSMDLVKKKGVRKERTRNCLPFTDFRSCCSKSEVNTSQENKEVCVSLSLSLYIHIYIYIYTRVCVCVCVCVCKSSISLCKIFYDVIYYCDPSEIILICRFGV